MDKTVLSPRTKAKTKSRGRRKKTGSLLNFPKDTKKIVLGGMGFFVGRIALFQFMNPIALAYCAGFLGVGHEFGLVLVLTGIGVITRFESVYLLKYLIALALLTGAEVFYKMSFINPGKRLKAATGAGATLIAGLLFAYFFGKSTYYAFMAVLETILAFSLFYVLQTGVRVFMGEKTKSLLDNETLISIAILMGAVIAGASDIYIGMISLKFLFSTLMILIMAYQGGSALGATAGVLFGFILTLSGYSNYSLVGIFSIAGMIAGILKDTGKIGSALGYAAGGLITSFYLDTGILDLSLLYSVVLGAVIFYLTPGHLHFQINTVLSGKDSENEYTERVRSVTSDRLMGFANSFKNLAQTFSGLSEKKSALDQRDISRLIDDVAAKVCARCPNQGKCWESNFYTTYQMSFALLEICEKKGFVTISDISDRLYESCEYIENFADGLNRTFELYKNNLLWHNRIVESRDLVSQQLLGVSGIITDLSDELSLELNFNKSLEDKILYELTKKHSDLEVQSVIVLENQQGKYEVTIQKAPCTGRVCTKEIIPTVNDILGRRMKKEEPECYARAAGGKKTVCKLRLVEESKFRIASGVARAKKEASAQSGDSYSLMDIKGGQCLLILSDGMGSGKKASRESEAAVEMLENFIDTGFDKETAIRIINSVLVLKSTDESFSTLDISSVNLYTGVGEFIKIGAASTFILRNGHVITVKSSSLPMGILNSVDVETTSKRLKDGDIIVMVTDGLTELTEEADKEAWIRETLAEFRGVNPQDVADYLLEKAREKARDGIKDDMTVLAARLWEKI